MFEVGQQVVCVDGKFHGPVRKLLAMVPEEGRSYTVRAVYLARDRAFPVKVGTCNGAIGVLLKELRNPVDRNHKWAGELGFDANRFKPLEVLVETGYLEEEEKRYRGEPVEFA